jgi:DNA-binding transcriptional LysR family regulator
MTRTYALPINAIMLYFIEQHFHYLKVTMDRLESMSTLLAAVETGSLSAASRKLGMPLATVSRKVSDLEAHLRTRLLNRTSRRLTLTDAGRSYVAACKRILEDIGEAERAVAGEYAAPRGDLMITAPIVFGRLHVLPVTVEFLKTYPDIDVRIALADRVVNLQEDDIDLAIRIGELPDSSLVATRVGTIRRVVCGSPAYFAGHGTPKSPGELSKHHCITFDGLTSPHSWRFLTGKSAVSVPIHSRLIVNTAEAAIDAAITGLGMTCVLSYQAAAALQAGTLSLALEKFEPVPSPVSLVYAGQGLLPQKLRAFLDFASPRLKARLAQG